MYSLSTSFWIVPVILSPGMPLSSATIWYISSSSAAGALIVIDVETSSSGSPSKSRRMSSIESIATPDLADLAVRDLGVGVVAHLGRQVERDRRARRCRWRRAACSARWTPWRCRSRRTAASSTGRPVYIDGYTPRVNGYSPGLPSRSSGPGRRGVTSSVSRPVHGLDAVQSPDSACRRRALAFAHGASGYGGPLRRRTVRFPLGTARGGRIELVTRDHRSQDDWRSREQRC